MPISTARLVAGLCESRDFEARLAQNRFGTHPVSGHRGRRPFQKQSHPSKRQYARIVHRWVARAGLDTSAYGTHSMRRTKLAQIYKKTGNLRTVLSGERRD